MVRSTIIIFTLSAALGLIPKCTNGDEHQSMLSNLSVEDVSNESDSSPIQNMTSRYFVPHEKIKNATKNVNTSKKEEKHLDLSRRFPDISWKKNYGTSRHFSHKQQDLNKPQNRSIHHQASQKSQYSSLHQKTFQKSHSSSNNQKNSQENSNEFFMSSVETSSNNKPMKKHKHLESMPSFNTKKTADKPHYPRKLKYSKKAQYPNEPQYFENPPYFGSPEETQYFGIPQYLDTPQYLSYRPPYLTLHQEIPEKLQYSDYNQYKNNFGVMSQYPENFQTYPSISYPDFIQYNPNYHEFQDTYADMFQHSRNPGTYSEPVKSIKYRDNFDFHGGRPAFKDYYSSLNNPGLQLSFDYMQPYPTERR